MVKYIFPYIICIIEFWANTTISDAELGLTGCVMFERQDVTKGGGIILYTKEYIQSYEIKLEVILRNSRNQYKQQRQRNILQLTARWRRFSNLVILPEAGPRIVGDQY